MRHSFLIIFLSFCGMAFSAYAQQSLTPQQRYIEKYSALAVEEMNRSGVPASITLAQGILESRSGQSELAVKANNHFGIKCHNWNGDTIHYDDDKRNECFRRYASADASYRDHSDFLRYRDRYRFLFSLELTDYEAWAYGLKKAGYATDPAYPQKLIKIIEEYELYRFDVPLPESDVTYDVDETFGFELARKVYSINGVSYVRAMEGETYSSIAEAQGLFLNEILRFNELSEEELLYSGTVVYVQKKKKKAAEGMDRHVAEEDGESLRDISQKYAVRLGRLARMNGLPKEYKLKNGESVKLR